LHSRRTRDDLECHFRKRSRNEIRGVESVLVLFIVRQRKESSVPYDERCEIAKDTKVTKAMSDDESIGKSNERIESFAIMN
jgi:hypothetical protein